MSKGKRLGTSRRVREQKSRGLLLLKLMAVSTLAHSILSISILHYRLKSLPSLHAFAGAWPGNEDNKNNGKRSAWNRIPTQADQNRYNRLRNNTNPITMTHDYFSTNFTVDRPFLPKFKFVYRGVSGLGHRLVRMSAMYHTARIYKILHLHVSWGWDCGEDEEGIQISLITCSDWVPC